MTISIIHPSKGRPDLAYQTIKKWLEYADLPVEYILSLDTEDVLWYFPAMESFVMQEQIKVIHHSNKSAIEAINVAVKETTGDLLLVVSDDFICPKNWCSKLIRHIDGHTDFIAKTRDGIQKTLITLPLMDRTYYNRFGYIYEPGYVHMWSDTEMTAVGHMLGRVIDIDMTFEHLHYTTGKSQKDAVNVKNDSSWKQGERLFNERLKTNFDIENPVIPYSEIKWK